MCGGQSEESGRSNDVGWGGAFGGGTSEAGTMLGGTASTVAITFSWVAPESVLNSGSGVGSGLHHSRGAGDSSRKICTGGDVVAKAAGGITDCSSETLGMGIRDVRSGSGGAGSGDGGSGVGADAGVGAGAGAGGADAAPRTPLRSSACATCGNSIVPSISLSNS